MFNTQTAVRRNRMIADMIKMNRSAWPWLTENPHHQAVHGQHRWVPSRTRWQQQYVLRDLTVNPNNRAERMKGRIPRHSLSVHKGRQEIFRPKPWPDNKNKTHLPTQWWIRSKQYKEKCAAYCRQCSRAKQKDRWAALWDSEKAHCRPRAQAEQKKPTKQQHRTKTSIGQHKACRIRITTALQTATAKGT